MRGRTPGPLPLAHPITCRLRCLTVHCLACHGRPPLPLPRRAASASWLGCLRSKASKRRNDAKKHRFRSIGQRNGSFRASRTTRGAKAWSSNIWN